MCTHWGQTPAGSDCLGSVGGGKAPDGLCPPSVRRRATGLLGPPLEVRDWTQLVTHVRSLPGSCSFPGVAGPPGPPPCFSGLAAPTGREREPAPPRRLLGAARSRRRGFLGTTPTREQAEAILGGATKKVFGAGRGTARSLGSLEGGFLR